MIIRTVAFAAVIAFGNTGAAAQDIGGRYKTECKLQNGASCSGTVEVEMTSENPCRIKWSDGTTASAC